MYRCSEEVKKNRKERESVESTEREKERNEVRKTRIKIEAAIPLDRHTVRTIGLPNSLT